MNEQVLPRVPDETRAYCAFKAMAAEDRALAEFEPLFRDAEAKVASLDAAGLLALVSARLIDVFPEITKSVGNKVARERAAATFIRLKEHLIALYAARGRNPEDFLYPKAR